MPSPLRAPVHEGRGSLFPIRARIMADRPARARLSGVPLLFLGLACARPRAEAEPWRDAKVRLSGRDVVQVVRDPPSFLLVTPGRMIAGTLGKVSMVMGGEDILHHHAIEDPAVRLQERCFPFLLRHLQAKSAHRIVRMDQDDEVRNHPIQGGLFLDIQTLGWQLASSGQSLSRYRLFYAARLRILDGTNGSVLLDHRTDYATPDAPDLPTLEGWLAENAHRLKAEMVAASDHCARSFEAQILGGSQPEPP